MLTPSFPPSKVGLMPCLVVLQPSSYQPPVATYILFSIYALVHNTKFYLKYRAFERKSLNMSSG